MPPPLRGRSIDSSAPASPNDASIQRTGGSGWWSTNKGANVRTELLDGMYSVPPELLEFDAGHLQQLRDLLASLPTGLDEFPQANV